VLLEVIQGLWNYVYSMIVTIPVDNALGVFYVIANLLLQLFGAG